MRVFNVPMSHPIIQNLTEYDLSFIEWSTALDDPVLRDKLENTVYDDDFDEWYDKVMSGENSDETEDSEESAEQEYEDLSETIVDNVESIDDWEEV